MRKITEIIVHCTSTMANPNVHVDVVNEWHKNRGFDCIGYHYLINTRGQIEIGRPLEMIGAHCRGHNANSIGICYVGGCDYDGRHMDTRTKEQKESMRILIDFLRAVYGKIPVHGHNYYNKQKDCPCFDADAEYNN